ncbi:hypothetical protein GA0070214_106138 [Micromonospora chaiyaphumensis]|uniref:Uncharacterized protein n=1 Tax=Micromonospora chaiyaphumensis TaxID=307119 RepID=A0A1C4XL17_9ACTN|nr:hypothetical protein [Micromonospora chaiyaphumensis]SCF09157.1 hypothetical protein GA0070214_106138 [Micromonospora chaiyaphumensis]
MSYPHQAPPRRPGAVVSAAALLLLMAVGAVAYAVASLLVTAGTVDRFREAARTTDASGGEIDGVASLLRGSTVLSAVLGVLVALLLVGLALGLLSGRAGARVATWVVAGLGLFCGCCGLAVLVGQRTAPLRLGADDRVTADLLARVGDAYPDWWIPVNAALSVAQILGYLVVAALLTLPSAGAFFHRRTPRPPAGPTPPSGPVAAAPAYVHPSPWGPPAGPLATPPPSAPPGPTPPPEDRP